MLKYPGSTVTHFIILFYCYNSVRSTELLSAVRNAKSTENDTKASKILGGALKQLKLSRLKPDTTLNSALGSLVREFPDMFSTPAVIEGLVLVLKREPSIIFKVKSNPSVYVLAAQLLLVALKDSHDWPEMVAKVSFFCEIFFYLEWVTKCY